MKKEDHTNELYFCHPKLTAHKAESELREGLRILSSVKRPIATIYGSHKVGVDDADFVLCQKLAIKLAKANFAIATGGGSGIMLAANSTAHIFGTDSIALKGSAFGHEHVDAPFYSHEFSFDFIFARRFILCIKSDALIVFPGGYGTLNELFELLVLIQSNIIEPVPVILMRKEYWGGLFEWLNAKLVGENMLTNDAKDLDIFSFADTAEEAMEIIHAKRKESDYHDKPHTCDICK